MWFWYASKSQTRKTRKNVEPFSDQKLKPKHNEVVSNSSDFKQLCLDFFDEILLKVLTLAKDT